MNNYTIYCTPEQTKKALELGASIRTCGYYYKQQFECNTVSETDLHILPTSEQMIGWLEDQDNIDYIYVYKNYSIWLFKIILVSGMEVWCESRYNSRPEATLAAIDAALEYLTKNKK